jgi:adenosylmethionine-8-amino-7-oxononanoate aminotransferase
MSFWDLHMNPLFLSEKLMEILPDNQQETIFFRQWINCVEVAIKVAMQFFLNKGKDNKLLLSKMLSWRYFAMAASGISFSSKL